MVQHVLNMFASSLNEVFFYFIQIQPSIDKMSLNKVSKYLELVEIEA